MARVTVVPDAIDYPDSDGLPMAETESQFWPTLYAGSALDRYYQDRDDVYVVGNLLLYYREGNPREGDFGASISADVMVVIGASKHVRPSYKLWEEPKAPDFVLEIASEGTYRADSGTKRDTFAEIGVAEYWQVDATGAFLRPPLQGFRLVAGVYQPIACGHLADGTLAARSDALGLELRVRPSASLQEALRFYDPVRGEPLRSLREAEQGRQEAEWARRETEDRLREGQAARRALEAELRELRLRGG